MPTYRIEHIDVAVRPGLRFDFSAVHLVDVKDELRPTSRPSGTSSHSPAFEALANVERRRVNPAYLELIMRRDFVLVSDMLRRRARRAR